MVEIIGIAHAAIFTQHRVLTELGREDAGTRALLDESVRIVFTDAPAATLAARSLAARWAEQQLLDPAGAERLRPQLAAEIEEAERGLRALLARQEEIAAELRARAS